MTVRDVQRLISSKQSVHIFSYWNGGDYGYIHGGDNSDDYDEMVMDSQIKIIGSDTMNGDDSCVVLGIDI